MKINESLIVGVSLNPDDTGVVIVGRQKNNKMEVINAFQGDEAHEIYKKLITKNENKGD